jgi:flagellar biosynthesis/type III secretory pathway protein FliH
MAIVELFEELSRSLDDLNRRRRQSLQEMQQVAVELSLLVASHILRERLDKDDFPVDRLVSEAMERLAPHQPIEIRLHPQDLQMMERKLGDQLPSWNKEHVRFIPDASLSRGSCFADAAECGLLSSLEQRLTDVRHQLLEGLDDAEVERRQTGSGADSLRRFPDRREIA